MNHYPFFTPGGPVQGEMLFPQQNWKIFEEKWFMDISLLKEKSIR
jgi:hypothetical protein